MKIIKVTKTISKTDSNSWNNEHWLRTRMNQTIMNLFILAFLKVKHIKTFRYTLAEELYADLILDIFSGKINCHFIPNDYSLTKMLHRKYLNIKNKEDRHDPKMQQMGWDTQNV